MRNYLFRGKRKSDGQWIYGFYVYMKNCPNDIHFIVPIDEENEECFASKALDDEYWNEINGAIEVDPETVGQWTGLTDKNGAKIFEGDILKYDRSKMPAVVEFTSSGKYQMKVDTPKGVRWYDMRNRQSEWEDGRPLEYHKVIGNIHDNPELLK
jgi:uncharacterized phage protein (TIGR01671 family)